MIKRTFLLLALVGFGWLGCSSSSQESPNDETPSPDTDRVGTCFYENQVVRIGETITARDGCEVCLCRAVDDVSCSPVDCEEPSDMTEEPSPEMEDMVQEEPEVEEDIPEEEDMEDEEVMDLGCVDGDLDGFYTCIDPAFPDRAQEVDCDDARFAAQPGGYEFPGNGFDDDCDGDIDEVIMCNCNMERISVAGAMAKSMDICSGELLQAELVGDPAQYGVLEAFPDGVEPRQGNCLAVLSTGRFDPPGNSSSSVQPGVMHNNLSDDPDPAGNAGEDVYDLVQLRLELKPPPNARGFRFRFMFLSSEWPEFLCDVFNDTFYAILESNAVQQGTPTNVSFDREGNGITVNVAFFELPRDWTTDLDDTAFGIDSVDSSCGGLPQPGCTLPEYCSQSDELGRVGSGSGWLTTQAPVILNEESITLTFSVHDESDAQLDSMVIIDDFQWLPFRTSVGTSKD